MRKNKKEYTCLFFGEGGSEKKFLLKLAELKKFEYHTERWIIKHDNTSGGGVEKIIENCAKAKNYYSADLSICFVDIDQLKKVLKTHWVDEKRRLTSKYPDVVIFWQKDNLEDEIRKVLKKPGLSKRKAQSEAHKQIKKFINSDYWKRIFRILNKKEKELSAEKQTD